MNEIGDKRTISTASSNSTSHSRRAAGEILLLCCTSRITPEISKRISRLIDSGVDWKYLLELAQVHGISPLIANSFIVSDTIKQIPQPYSVSLKNNYYNNLRRNILLSGELVGVLSAFNRHCIPVITLKGIVLAEQLYGNLGLRSVADIDILVNAENLASAHSLLTELGYRQSPATEELDHPFHEVPYAKNGQLPFSIELHRELENPELVTIPYDELWGKTQKLEIQDAATMVLSPEDTFLYLANNFAKQNEGVLKYLCDIRMLLIKNGDSLDWSYITSSAVSWGIKASVFFAMKRSREIFGEKIPASAFKALKPSGFRLKLLDFLVNNEYLVLCEKGKIKTETFEIFYSLLMEHPDQTFAVLSRFRGSEKRFPELRAAFWVVLVFIAAAGRNISHLFKGKGFNSEIE